MTPPLSISAMPRLTRAVPVTAFSVIPKLYLRSAISRIEVTSMRGRLADK